MNTTFFFLEVTTGWFSEAGEIHNICRAWTLFALLAIWGEPRANIGWKCGQNKKENQVQPPSFQYWPSNLNKINCNNRVVQKVQWS